MSAECGQIFGKHIKHVHRHINKVITFLTLLARPYGVFNKLEEISAYYHTVSAKAIANHFCLGTAA